MKRLLLLLPLLAACGPIPVEQAERECHQRARLAQQPRGSVAIGGSSSGDVVGGLDLSISSDWLAGRDPSAVYDACVMQKSGQMPSRPFYVLGG